MKKSYHSMVVPAKAAHAARTGWRALGAEKVVLIFWLRWFSGRENRKSCANRDLTELIV
jgi:hypothetical protein